MYVGDLSLTNICLRFGGMTSVIRVADVGFYGTHILFGGERTHTGDLKMIIIE